MEYRGRITKYIRSPQVFKKYSSHLLLLPISILLLPNVVGPSLAEKFIQLISKNNHITIRLNIYIYIHMLYSIFSEKLRKANSLGFSICPPLPCWVFSARSTGLISTSSIFCLGNLFWDCFAA